MSRSSRAMARLFLLVAGPFVLGCRADPRAVHRYELKIPDGWKPWRSPELPLAPGKILEAYEVPVSEGGGSLIVFRSGYLPLTEAKDLLIQTRYLLLNLPSLDIEEAKEVQLNAAGGRPGAVRAALVSLTAEGTGNALAPTGLGKPLLARGSQGIRTRRIWVRAPRGPEGGTLEVFFHCPESAYPRLKSTWEEVLASLKA